MVVMVNNVRLVPHLLWAGISIYMGPTSFIPSMAASSLLSSMKSWCVVVEIEIAAARGVDIRETVMAEVASGCRGLVGSNIDRALKPLLYN